MVSVRVRIPQEFGAVSAVRTRSNPDREPQFAEARLVASLDGWGWWEADIDALNPVHGYRFLISMTDGAQWWLNAAGLHDIETLDSEDFKLLCYPPPPEWAASSVMYQIFPDRFGRSQAADDRESPEWAVPAEWSDEVDL